MAKKAPRTKKADKGPKLVKHTKGPRSQTLPGHELVRDGRLDNLCEEIGDGLEQINKGTTAVKESKATALARMRDKGLMRYHFAGVTIRLREGADKLSVKLEKETQDPGGEPKASTEPPAKSETVN